MLFSEIVSYLSHSVPCTVLANEMDQEIHSVKLVDPKETSFQADTLYFGYNVQFISILPPQCILAGSFEDVEQWKNRANLAILSQDDFSHAFNEASRLLDISRKTGFYDSMASTLERVKNVDALIDIASQAFGASLVFIDLDFRILSHSVQIPVKDTYWQRNIEQGYCDFEFIQAVRSLKSVKMADSSSAPIEVSCPSSPFQKFAGRVYCRDVWVGYLIVIEDYNSYRSEHAEMLKALCGIVGHAVMRYAPGLLYKTDEYHQFLYNLMIGADINTLPKAYRDLAFPAQLRVLCCKAYGDMRAFTDESRLSESVNHVLTGSHVILIRNHAIIIGSAALSDKAEEILALFPRGSRVKIGVSREFDRIELLRAAYMEAHETCKTGAFLSPEDAVYSFDDYGLYNMLLHVSEREDLSHYLHRALRILLRYDSENETDLTETLRTYLEQNRNIKETAEKLFLHRNSLVYRINRIQELCAINLNDVNTCLLLRVSFMILTILKKQQHDTQ